MKFKLSTLDKDSMMKNEKWTISIPLPSAEAVGVSMTVTLFALLILEIIISVSGGLSSYYTPTAVESNGDSLIIQTDADYGWFENIWKKDDQKVFTFSWTTGDLDGSSTVSKGLVQNIYSQATITILEIKQAPTNENLSWVAIRVEFNSSTYERELVRIDGEWFDKTAVRPLRRNRDASLEGILEPLYRNKICTDAFTVASE